MNQWLLLKCGFYSNIFATHNKWCIDQFDIYGNFNIALPISLTFVEPGVSFTLGHLVLYLIVCCAYVVWLLLIWCQCLLHKWEDFGIEKYWNAQESLVYMTTFKTGSIKLCKCTSRVSCFTLQSLFLCPIAKSVVIAKIYLFTLNCFYFWNALFVMPCAL